MKRLRFCVAATIALVAASVHSAVNTWTGEAGVDGDGKYDWFAPGNWSETVCPTVEDDVVFTNESKIVVKIQSASPKFRNISFKGADVDLDPNNAQWVTPPDGCEWFVKEGTTVSFLTFGVYAVTGANHQYKTGAGTIVFHQFKLNASEGHVEVCAGEMQILDNSHSFQTRYLTIRSGGTFHPKNWNLTGSDLVIHIEKGGVLDSNAGTGQFTYGNIVKLTGEGEIKDSKSTSIFWLKPDASLGDSVFSGTFGSGAQLRLRDESTGRLVIGSADTLNVGSSLEGCGRISFLPGIGTFKLGNITPNAGHPLHLADTNGDPVTVSVNTYYVQHNNMAFDGPGDVVLTDDGRTIIGTNFCNTGFVRSAVNANAWLTLDGTDANDFDFSSLAGVDATVGNLQINNAGAVSLKTVLGEKSIYFNAPTTVESYDVNGASAGIFKGLTINGGNGVSSSSSAFLFALANQTLTVNGGAFYGSTGPLGDENLMLAPLPVGMLIQGDHKNTGTLRLNGGDLWVRMIGSYYGARNVEVNGGRLHQTQAPLTALSGLTAENPMVITLNGGELLFSRQGATYYVGQSLVSDTDALQFKIGPKGGCIASEHVYNYTSLFDMNGSNFTGVMFDRPILTGVTEGTDGGLVQRGFHEFRYKYPFTISGPYTAEGGSTRIPAALDLSATPSCFGTGDTVLRNHYLTFEDRTEAFSFRPHGAGKKLTVGGGSAIQLRTSAAAAPVSVTIDNLAFEPGGVLYLHDMGGFGNVGAAPSTVKLATPPETAANGRVQLPVFGTRDGNTLGSTFCVDFLGYDAEKGFVHLDAGTEFGEGKLVRFDVDTWSGANKTLLADAMLLGSYTSYHLEHNSVLRIGDGTHPAYLGLRNGSIIGDETASIEFGASEGVILCSSVVYNDCSTGIQVPIKSANGLTVTSYPDIRTQGWRGVKLSGENTYSGVTRIGSSIVQAEHERCFSAGDVYVSGGDRHGGGVRFNKEGATWANNFHISGRGIRKTNNHGAEYAGFAMNFAASGTVAGDVEIRRLARLIAYEGVTGEIAGTVSGGRLELLFSPGSIRLSHANTYSDGTDVLNSVLELGAEGAAGTGRIWLGNGTLRFVNAEPIVFTNRIVGTGTIVLAGAPVTFTDKSMGALAGRTFAKGTSIDFPNFTACTLKTAAVVTGGTLDLGGKDLSVDEIWGAGRVTGGTLTVTGEINPGNAGAIGTLAFETAPLLGTGSTLVIEDDDGACDSLVVENGDLDLTDLALAFRLIGTSRGKGSATIVSVPNGVCNGPFASVTKTPKKAERALVEYGASTVDVQLSFGSTILVR